MNPNTPIRTAASFASPSSARSELTNDPTLATVKRCVHVRSPADPLFIYVDEMKPQGSPVFFRWDMSVLRLIETSSSARRERAEHDPIDRVRAVTDQHENHVEHERHDADAH